MASAEMAGAQVEPKAAGVNDAGKMNNGVGWLEAPSSSRTKLGPPELLVITNGKVTELFDRDKQIVAPASRSTSPSSGNRPPTTVLSEGGREAPFF